MLPIFVGLAIWIVLCTIGAVAVSLVSRRLRPYSGFVLFTPTLGIVGSLFGFMGVGWFFNQRARPELAMSLAFYLGFLLCGAIGSAIGMAAGFAVWKHFRRQAVSQQLTRNC